MDLHNRIGLDCFLNKVLTSDGIKGTKCEFTEYSLRKVFCGRRPHVIFESQIQF